VRVQHHRHKTTPKKDTGRCVSEPTTHWCVIESHKERLDSFRLFLLSVLVCAHT
jgi:hypothetical protein